MSTPTTYYVCMTPYGQKPRFVKCPSAERVVIPGFESFGFFGHHVPCFTPDGKRVIWDNETWRISEATTGRGFGFNDRPSLHESIEVARLYLELKGTDVLSEAIRVSSKSPFCASKEESE